MAKYLALGVPALGLGSLAAISAFGAGSEPAPNGPAKSGASPIAFAATNPCTGFGVQPITMVPTVPTRFSSSVNQVGADCMAWQTFIALNWQADPARPGYPDPAAQPTDFGTVNNPNPTVWLSYADADTVFSGGSGTSHKLAFAAARPARLKLATPFKFDTVDLSLSGIQQAGDRKWLTSQRGDLTYYDVRINEDEFQFIKTNVFSGNDLTTYGGQGACAAQPGQIGPQGLKIGGFNLPGGSGADVDCTGTPKKYGQDQGAIEIKSAWIPLPADGSLNYRYLTATATIVSPSGQQTTQTVGLVGLHIVHKVQGAQQLLWATFEQIDNSPDQSSNAAGFSAPVLPANPNQIPTPAYTYFNPQCDPSKDTAYACVHNQLPGKPCDANGQPAGCVPYSAPMQITRLVSVDQTANATTGYAWSLFPKSSVFNYYRLINVQWPGSSTAIAPGSKTPLCTGDIQPPSASGRVANVTMETFQQDKNSCMDCHQGAPIAQARQLTLLKQAGMAPIMNEIVRPKALTAGSCGGSNNFASNYSFLFIAETRR